MPTILRAGPYRFFFYSSDRVESPHVHIEGNGGIAKVWLEPLRLGDARGFTTHGLSRVFRLVKQHRIELLRAWRVYFDQ